MKKILLAVLLPVILGTVFTVCADMGAPVFLNYSAVVINPDGAFAYQFKYDGDSSRYEPTDGYFPYGTSVDVWNEFDMDGTEYVTINYSGNSFTLLADDVAATEYLPAEGLNFDQINTYYVFREGCYLYKGPADSFEKVDGEIMIPIGTTFTAYDTYDAEWSMVSYGGANGWVRNANADANYKETFCAVRYGDNIPESDRVTFYTMADLPIREYPEFDSAITGYIPAGYDIIIDNCYRVGRGSSAYYIEYDGICGWITPSDNTVAYPSHEIYGITTDLPMYSAPIPNGTVIGTVPAGTTVYTTYSMGMYDDYCLYTCVNGLGGWIQPDWSNTEYLSGTPYPDALDYPKPLSGDGPSAGMGSLRLNDAVAFLGDNAPTANADFAAGRLSTIAIVLICVICSLISAAFAVVLILLINRKHK